MLGERTFFFRFGNALAHFWSKSADYGRMKARQNSDRIIPRLDVQRKTNVLSATEEA